MFNTYYVYILTNQYNTVLYTGVTNNLDRRLLEHRSPFYKGFTHKYRINKLVYFEEFTSISDAINREKQLKSGSRQAKIELIQSLNPNWEELAPSS